ncbi:MAG TPA: hypothetical protein VF789_33535 [Thermoanaerobaculia bacterium]
MFCPECGLEFEESSVQCDDCEVDLVADPPEEEEEGGSGPVEFHRLVEVVDVADFAVVTSSLEESGIPWFVQNENGTGVVIYVAANRLPEAMGLLEITLGVRAQS